MLSQINVSLPDASSPWLCWIIAMGMAVAFFISMLVYVRKATVAYEQDRCNDGHVILIIMSGLCFITSFIYSLVMFYAIFSKTIGNT